MMLVIVFFNVLYPLEKILIPSFLRDFNFNGGRIFTTCVYLGGHILKTINVAIPVDKFLKVEPTQPLTLFSM